MKKIPIILIIFLIWISFSVFNQSVKEISYYPDFLNLIKDQGSQIEYIVLTGDKIQARLTDETVIRTYKPTNENISELLIEKEIPFRGIAVHLAVSQVIQANLKEIGLDVEIVSYDPSVYTMNAMNPAGGWDMAMYSMGCPSFLTADCYNAFLLNLAIGGYKADDFVATINKALAETDLTKMAPYSKQLNEIILRDVPMFAYMETPIINAFNNSLNGYTLGYINNIPVRLLSF